MLKEIKRFEDGTIIEQGRGRFDDYCVYLTRFGQGKYAPKDEEYFSFFIEKSQKYSSEKIYSDYVCIYEKTTEQIDCDILEDIEEISKSYDEEDRIDFCVWYSVIYLGMIAEERRKNAVLKKRIKRLGMYQILFERMSAVEAAKFSINKRATELSLLCDDRGF